MMFAASSARLLVAPLRPGAARPAFAAATLAARSAIVRLDRRHSNDSPLAARSAIVRLDRRHSNDSRLAAEPQPYLSTCAGGTRPPAERLETRPPRQHKRQSAKLYEGHGFPFFRVPQTYTSIPIASAMAALAKSALSASRSLLA